MEFSRRNFLRAGLLTATTVASACRPLGAKLAGIPDENPEVGLSDPSPTLQPPVVEEFDAARRLRFLNRAGYGPRPGDLAAAAAVDFEELVAQQLNPSQIDDHDVEALLASNDLIHSDLATLLDEEPRDLILALSWETIARKLYSQRQLYETLVDFWSDHFHIYPRKARSLFALKIIDDQTVIRHHALGRFRDLLEASLYSPAMLVYLDNARNVAASPNENYARELLELHTLGVDGGYAQSDVENVARLLTGLTISRRGNQRGQVVFNNRQHDNGEKIVMGQFFAAQQGEQDISDLLDFLAHHPQTSRFMATKLVRRFISDSPPADLVASTAEVFQQSEGDIPTVLRHIFLSQEFAIAPPKLKRPLKFFVSACRAVDAEVRPSPMLGDFLGTLGQVPFMWPAPNGYPDVAVAWTGTLLPRWNFALTLAHNKIKGIEFSPLDDEFVSQNVAAPHLASSRLREGFSTYLAENDNRHGDLLRRDLLALWLSSPEFQWV